ncbi:MAG: LysM peptidoglycan-binding domain-containing protein [Anaerolineales bacterium]|nr:LysM peptidoglycan-binding domain-containing protein [Anaerolineales bacterium]MCZ2120651.1 LysM peptidoglycan-binding domain-containing protein [Anaerolineales bacterium]
MSNTKRGLVTFSWLVIASLLITACQKSLSQAPAATPTQIATGLFVSPFPSAENPLDMIAEFAKQTSVAQTVAAGGVVTTGTPNPIAGTPTPQNGTPQPAVTNITSTPGVPATDSANLSTPTNANMAVATTASAPTIAPANSTPVPQGVRPASYTLQAGEFPFCIARRFNVDPYALLSASGLTSPDLYYPGLTLKIPQSGSFPGERMLISHPATYSVLSSDETLYSIACKYGDVDPGQIASANGIATGSTLSVGQQIKIP